MSTRAPKAALGLALALALAAVLAVPGTAAAHNDMANLSVESQEADGPLTMSLRVSARYTNDDELVEAIDLTVAGTGPGGEALAATPMTAVPDTVGLYEADLTFPVGGIWTLEVRATDPEGALNATVQVEDGSTATTTGDGAEDDEQGSEGDDPSTAGTVAPSEEGSDDDSSNVVPIVGGLLLVLVVGGAVAYVVVRRRGGDDPDL